MTEFTYGDVFSHGEIGDAEITVTMTVREAATVGLAFNEYVESGMFLRAFLKMREDDPIAAQGFYLALAEANSRLGAILARQQGQPEHENVFAGARAWLDQQKAEWRDAA